MTVGRRSILTTAVVAATVLTSLLATGCSSSDDESSGTSSSSTSSTSPTTSEPTSTTSTTLFIYADEPPDLVTTGDDWDAILNSLLGYLDWATVQLDVSLIAPAICPGSPEFADTSAVFQRADELGVVSVEIEEVAHATEVALVADDRPTAVLLSGVQPRPGFSAKDAEGVVQLSLSPGPDRELIFEIRQGAGEFCLWDQTVTGERSE